MEIATAIQGFARGIKFVLDIIVWLVKAFVWLIVFCFKAAGWIMLAAVIIAAIYFAFKFARWLGSLLARPKESPEALQMAAEEQRNLGKVPLFFPQSNNYSHHTNELERARKSENESQQE